MRTWSENNGRADIAAGGFSPLALIGAAAAGLIILGAAISAVVGLS